MHFTSATVLALAGIASAHTHMFSVWVNGEDQGDGRSRYIRSPPNNSPIKDLTLPAVACNVKGGEAVPEFVTAAAGDSLTFEWYHDARGDDIIAESHKGPIITYIAEYTESDGSDAGWTKISQDGLDGDQWAVDRLIAAQGKWDFRLPASLKAGRYLIRQEVIGLHEADVAYSEDPARGAQLYPSCVQVEVTGGGATVPDQGFSFATGYTDQTPGIVFNIYPDEDEDGEDGEGDGEGAGDESANRRVRAAAPLGEYSIPGPELWTEAAPGSGSGGNATGTRSLRIKGRAVVRV